MRVNGDSEAGFMVWAVKWEMQIFTTNPTVCFLQIFHNDWVIAHFSFIVWIKGYSYVRLVKDNHTLWNWMNVRQLSSLYIMVFGCGLWWLCHCHLIQWRTGSWLLDIVQIKILGHGQWLPLDNYCCRGWITGNGHGSPFLDSNLKKLL